MTFSEDLLEIMNQNQQIDTRVAAIQEGNRESYLKLEEQAQSVLRQISELYATVSRIRAQQNAFLPALRVHDDILIAIFSHLLNAQNAKSHVQNLLLVTSVCSRWRAVATEVPSLWTIVHLVNPALTSLFLARSRPALVSIISVNKIFHSRGPKQLAAFAGMPQDRIGSLQIDMNSVELCEKWMSRLSTLPAPALQHLNLRLYDDEPAVGFPIFANETPLLRSLTLESIVFPPTSSLFSNLRHLSLCDVFSREGYRFQPLLEILSRSPALETLRLDSVHSLGGQYRGLAPGTRPAPLTRLRRFDMVALHPCALRLIPHLGFPDDTTSHIIIDTSRFLAGDAILDHPLAFKGITFLRHTASTPSYSMPNTFLSAYHGEFPAEDSKPVLLLKAENRIPQVSTLLGAFDLRSVVRFEMDATMTPKPDDGVYWYTVLKQLPALRTLLIVRGWHMVECLTALMPQSLANEAPSHVCPALEHLELREFVFQAGAGPALEIVATTRWNAGFPLKSISLFVAWGGVQGEVISTIRERVDTVIVRG